MSDSRQSQRAAASNTDPAPSLPDPETLWEDHGLEVFFFARTRLSDRENARDVCQQTFVRALSWLQNNGDKVPNKPNYGAWLKRIALNIIIDWYRSSARRTTRAVDFRADTEFEHWLETPSEAFNPANGLEGELQIQALRRCMAELSDHDRELVEARVLREQPYEVISEHAAISAGNARVRLFRTLQALRRCVESRLHAESRRAL